MSRTIQSWRRVGLYAPIPHRTLIEHYGEPMTPTPYDPPAVSLPPINSQRERDARDQILQPSGVYLRAEPSSRAQRITDADAAIAAEHARIDEIMSWAVRPSTTKTKFKRRK